MEAVVGVTGGRADDQRRRGWDKGRPFIIILFLQISGCRLTRPWASRIWWAVEEIRGRGGEICKGNRGVSEGCDLPAREFRLFRSPFVPNFDSDGQSLFDSSVLTEKQLPTTLTRPETPQ